jgi:tetratricopeptide (TPR) repeat protein
VKPLAAAAIILGLALFATPALAGDKTEQYYYSYGANGINESVPGFQLAMSISASQLPVKMTRVDAISAGFGKIFIADSAQARINVLNGETCEFEASIKLIRGSDNKIVIQENGEQLMLKGPEGVYACEELEEIYIADTAGERIIVLDSNDYSLKKIIAEPSNFVGATSFKPSKISVDGAGRIYFVVQGSYEGIIELNPNGEFSRFYGVNKPKVNILDYFWKSLASDEQKQKMAKSFAPSFSDIDIDSEGFVYATTFDISSEKMIFRFNAKGENVIREEGYLPLQGDFTRFFEFKDTPSAFTAISESGFGAYAVVDKTYGRVFVYDFDGQVITIFSKLGNMKGDLREPSAISWNGYDLLVGDKALGVVHVYKPTQFGLAALQATESYSKGEWAKATELYERAVALNANFYAGYSGIGRNCLMQRDYSQAVYYFKLAQDSKGYSQAYNGYRAESTQKWFPIYFAVVLALIGLIVYSEVRYVRKSKTRF